jgi:hypothetical protein
MGEGLGRCPALQKFNTFNIFNTFVVVNPALNT